MDWINSTESSGSDSEIDERLMELFMGLERNKYKFSSNDEEDENSGRSQSESSDERQDPPEPERDPELNTFLHQITDVFQAEIKNQSADFATGGDLPTAPVMAIRLEQSSDTIHFPIYEKEAKKFIKYFEHAPFGKGEKTLVDTTVRNSFQLPPSSFTILNPKWNSFVSDTVVPLVAKGFNLQTPFTASLYKLLLYQAGSFFKPHRDTEKEQGMFGTLIIQLPSKYDGGKLIVNHEQKSQFFDFSSSSYEFSTAYAALYCDCEHELLPVTSGYRACLVYNLVTSNSIPVPVLPKTGIELAELNTILQSWPNDEPALLAYYLSHKYTQQNLSFNTLKSSDKHIASLLQAAAAELNLHIYLCLFERVKYGKAADYNELCEDTPCPQFCYKKAKPGCRDFKFHEDAEVEMHYEFYDLISPDGKLFPYVTTFNDKKLLRVNFTADCEFIPPDIFKTVKPESLELEPTGNEGTDMTKWYKGAAILFWPDSKNANVLTAFDIPDTVIETNAFLNKIKEFGDKVDMSSQKLLRAAAKQFVKLDENEKKSFQSTEALQGDPTANTLTIFKTLCSFQDLTLVKQYITKYGAILEMVPIMKKQCDLFGWETWFDGMEIILKQTQKCKFIESLTAEDQGVTDDKKDFYHRLVKIALDHSANLPFQDRLPYYMSVVEICQSIFASCANIGLDITEIGKTLNLHLLGSILIKLSENLDKKLNQIWHPLAQYNIQSMELFANQNVKQVKRRDKLAKKCQCEDCTNMQTFLRSANFTHSFKVPKSRRTHIVNQIAKFPDMKNETISGINPTFLLVTKLVPGGIASDMEPLEKISKLKFAIGLS